MQPLCVTTLILLNLGTFSLGYDRKFNNISIYEVHTTIQKDLNTHSLVFCVMLVIHLSISPQSYFILLNKVLTLMCKHYLHIKKKLLKVPKRLDFFALNAIEEQFLVPSKPFRDQSLRTIFNHLK